MDKQALQIRVLDRNRAETTLRRGKRKKKGLTDRQTDRHIDRQRNIQTYNQRQINGQAEKEMERG